jgi:hypothetical protein
MGLIRGVARTAAIAGTATAVSNRVSRRQANRWAGQDQAAYAQQAYAQPAYEQPPPAPAPAAPSESDTLDQLAKLGQLHQSGVLTDEEFAAQKAKILGL